ncbi:MAG: YcaO-like family protein [Bdellovibrionales bacterium]
MKNWLDENSHLEIENSNGFAAHVTEDLARQAAIFERVERDAVLAQWYTATPFLLIAPETLPIKLQAWRSSELAQSEFPNLRILLSTQGLGPSVTCVLMNREGFGVSGHSTNANLLEAIEGAIAEACRAAHLYLRRSFWSDSLLLRSEQHDVHKVKPGAHALYYAYHEPFPIWMFGREMSSNEAKGFWKERMQVFAQKAMPNFSFQVLLREPLAVGFAHSSDCFELTWGPCDPARILSSSANKRFASPISERSLNRQPHIVS